MRMSKPWKQSWPNLKADNEQSARFVIYKGAFSVSTETTIVSFNPTIVMRPELAKSARGIDCGKTTRRT
ncbi:MAG: hypothetical protein ACLR0U_00745 [Enterocloster clostridioformis]